MKNTIDINNVSKSFGKIKILDEISLQVDSGNCYCLLGKNGIGKSTLLNIVSDIYSADSGKISILGMNYKDSDLEIKARLGVLPENLPLIEELSGKQYLKFIALLYSLDSKALSDRSREIIAYFFEENEFMDRKIETYSKGMKIKLAFCAILLHKPEILILDEPFLAWDPIGVNSLINFINDYVKSGGTVLLSSHNLLYIDKIATHIAVLDNSKIVFSSTLDDFKENGSLEIDESIRKHIIYNEQKKISWI